MGRQVLATQPFSVLVGTEMHALSPGLVDMQLPMLTEKVRQQPLVHGGVVSYLADNALTFAGGTAMQVPVVTAEYKINYIRPAIGERLIARAKAVHVGKSQSVCTCEIFASATASSPPTLEFLLYCWLHVESFGARALCRSFARDIRRGARHLRADRA